MEFVLGQYIERGIDQLAAEKLASLLELRNRAVSDATVKLGNGPESIREAFVGFQRDLFDGPRK